MEAIVAFLAGGQSVTSGVMQQGRPATEAGEELRRDSRVSRTARRHRGAEREGMAHHTAACAGWQVCDGS
jgi:hypothetical protein